MNLSLIVFITLIGICVSRDIIGNCVYEDHGTDYVCRFSAEPIKLEDDVIAVSGTHAPGFTDASVTSIIVEINSVVAATPIILCEKFGNVRTMILSRIQLHNVTGNSFSRCINLEFIYMNQNQLVEFAPNALQNNVRLDRVDLDRNTITQIYPTSFRGLTNLKHLTLRDNLITEIPQNAFSDLVNIEEILLFSNRIARIHPDFLDTLPAGHAVTMNFFNNICISQFIVFTRANIDQLRPLFSQCFNNYRQHYGLV